MALISLLCCAAMVLTACSSSSSSTAATEAAAAEEAAEVAEAAEEEAEEEVEEAEAVEAEAEEEVEEAEAVEEAVEEEAAEAAEEEEKSNALIMGEALEAAGITVTDLAAAGGALPPWLGSVDEDELEFKFMKAAAYAGYSDAAFSLGEEYHAGTAFDSDEIEDKVAEAVKWWTLAGDNGSPRGYADIGLLYLHESVPGGGDEFGDIPYDEDIAFEYFQKSVDGGDEKGARYLAQCYENGWGCDVDPAMAFECYELAADRGDSTATVEVADRYLAGNGVDQDVEKAMSMYQEIVDEVGHDVVECAQKLGEIYENGEYVDADSAKAAEYYQIALDNAKEGTDAYTEAEESLARVSG